MLLGLKPLKPWELSDKIFDLKAIIGDKAPLISTMHQGQIFIKWKSSLRAIQLFLYQNWSSRSLTREHATKPLSQHPTNLPPSLWELKKITQFNSRTSRWSLQSTPTSLPAVTPLSQILKEKNQSIVLLYKNITKIVLALFQINKISICHSKAVFDLNKKFVCIGTLCNPCLSSLLVLLYFCCITLQSY